MPAAALSDAQAAAERRHLSIHDRQVSFDGTVEITGELDLADALDLDDALARGAASLAAGGCEESLDVRRSMAAGEIARRQLALDLSSVVEPVETTTTKARPKPRQVVLYVHLSEAAIRGTGEGIDLARVENRRQGVTADQVRVWCANPDTHVVVKPVIDLAEHISVNAYEVPDRLAEQARSARRHLRLPLVHPPRPKLRLRPRHPPRTRRSHLLVQHSTPVQTTSPVENPPLWLVLHGAGTRLLPLVEPARLPVPPRP